MNICGECDLPVPACNAIAMYRDAFKYLKAGNIDKAKEYAERGQEWEDEFRRQRNAAPQP